MNTEFFVSKILTHTQWIIQGNKLQYFNDIIQKEMYCFSRHWQIVFFRLAPCPQWKAILLATSCRLISSLDWFIRIYINNFQCLPKLYPSRNQISSYRGSSSCQTDNIEYLYQTEKSNLGQQAKNQKEARALFQSVTFGPIMCREKG